MAEYCPGGCPQLSRRGRLRNGEDLGVPRAEAGVATRPSTATGNLRTRATPRLVQATDTAAHQHHIWDVGRVRALVADHQEPVTFFCGGSRNFSKFIDLFDEVFVLDIDLETLHRRLDQRPQDEWGSKPSERDLIVRLHRTKEDIPGAGRGDRRDATARGRGRRDPSSCGAVRRWPGRRLAMSCRPQLGTLVRAISGRSAPADAHAHACGLRRSTQHLGQCL